VLGAEPEVVVLRRQHLLQSAAPLTGV
jgi:hypothetical protein